MDFVGAKSDECYNNEDKSMRRQEIDMMKIFGFTTNGKARPIERTRQILGRVPVQPSHALPDFEEYKWSGDKPWNVIPLGVSNDGEECWDLTKVSHGMVTGITGSGKSTLERSILYHVFQHPNEIFVYGIDLKQADLNMWEQYPGMVKVATDLESASEAISEAESILMYRLSNGTDRRENEPAILVMFDESAQVFIPSKGSSPEVERENALKKNIVKRVNNITKFGRAANVHALVCTQSTKADAVGGDEAKGNYGFRIILEPGVKGRGVISRYGSETRFQSYWTPEDMPMKQGIHKVSDHYRDRHSPTNQWTMSMKKILESGASTYEEVVKAVVGPNLSR